MLKTGVDSLNATFQKTHEWLGELAEIGPFQTEAQAYSALRAVLQVLRDRLTADEAAHLAAQLPMLVRGMFYEGWRPATVPRKLRSREEFLVAMIDHLGGADIEPELACRAVFELLERKVTAGEVEDVRHLLPGPVRDLWP